MPSPLPFWAGELVATGASIGLLESTLEREVVQIQLLAFVSKQVGEWWYPRKWGKPRKEQDLVGSYHLE